MMSRAGAATFICSKCTATASTMPLTPTVPTLVAACMRVKRSGILMMPMAESSMNRLPISSNADVMMSFNAVPPVE